MVVEFVQRHSGITPRFILPADLRLLPDAQAKGGYKLCCVVKSSDSMVPSSSFLCHNGEILEEIHQLGLELRQQELRALQPEMLHQISLRCFNDLRTILLVHDKRMLGIVKQEIKDLVARNVLTPMQAEALNKGIADTILPGSLELQDLIRHCKESPGQKDEYILKPVRSGKGDGIVFGKELSSAEWISRLQHLSAAQLSAAYGGACIAQRRVKQLLYDVILRPTGVKTQYPLIGTYHSINGEFLGLGIWRSSPDQICAVSHGGAWMCSVTRGDCD